MTSGGALVALAALLAGPVAGQESYRLSGSRVAVYNLAGQVEVVRGSGSDVVVTLSRGGDDAAQLEVETREVDGYDALVIRYPSDDVVYDRGRGGNSSTTLRVRDDGTWGGRVGEASAVGLRGDVELDIGAGRASVEDVVGDVSVDTGSGGVTVAGVQGEVLVDTGSGSVQVEGVRGPMLSVDTGSGSVDASSVSVSSSTSPRSISNW